MQGPNLFQFIISPINNYSIYLSSQKLIKHNTTDGCNNMLLE